MTTISNMSSMQSVGQNGSYSSDQSSVNAARQNNPAVQPPLNQPDAQSSQNPRDADKTQVRGVRAVESVAETQKLSPAQMTAVNVAQIKEREETEKESKEDKEASEQRINEAIAKLNNQNIGLSFSIDDDVGRTVISVMDRNTDDLVRQIPSEDFLKLVKRLEELTATPKSSAAELTDQSKAATLGDFTKDQLKGLLLDDEA